MSETKASLPHTHRADHPWEPGFFGDLTPTEIAHAKACELLELATPLLVRVKEHSISTIERDRVDSILTSIRLHLEAQP